MHTNDDDDGMQVVVVAYTYLTARFYARGSIKKLGPLIYKKKTLRFFIKIFVVHVKCESRHTDTHCI